MNACVYVCMYCNYPATVSGIRQYGAFMELSNGMNGLLHISQISYDRVEDVHKVFSVGQKIKVCYAFALHVYMCVCVSASTCIFDREDHVLKVGKQHAGRSIA